MLLSSHRSLQDAAPELLGFEDRDLLVLLPRAIRLAPGSAVIGDEVERLGLRHMGPVGLGATSQLARATQHIRAATAKVIIQAPA